MAEYSVGKYLKLALSPSGTLPVVPIGFQDGISGIAYFDKSFIDDAIDDMTARLQSACVHPISALEQLAIKLLLASAYVSKPEELASALKSQASWETKAAIHNMS